MTTNSEIKIRIEGAVAFTTAPYHPDFVKIAKALNGRWKPEIKGWAFDARDTGRICDALRSVFGITPTIEGAPSTAPSGDTVTIRVEVTSEAPNPLWGFGRLLAERRHRDLPVRLGNGVVVYRGEFPEWAGTRRSPELLGSWDGPVTLEVRDVPRAIADDAHAPSKCRWEIAEEESGRKARLLAEREALLKRLSEVEAELRQLGIGVGQ
jgi:hypothetical protein